MTSRYPSPTMAVRLATPDDLDQLVELRLQLFACFPQARDTIDDDTMRTVSKAYFTRAFEQGDCQLMRKYHCLLACRT